VRTGWLASVVVLAVVVAAAALISCSSSGNGDGTENHVFENRSAALSLTVPVGWHATSHRFTSLLDPRERVALASFPIDDTARSRRCSPDIPLGQMPRSGVLALLLEYMNPTERRHALRVDHRPERFRLGQPAMGSFDCFPAPPGRAGGYVFNFGDSGRAFQLLVAVGTKATPETRLAAAAALDSIRIEPCDRPLPSTAKPACRRPLPH
jgi:hypothetical protein